jgi:LemA protein
MIYLALGIPILLLLFIAVLYNRLVRLRNRVLNAWSDIDVQLKRRHDLVPNLVEAAQGYMQHERDTLEAVTRARSQAVASGGDLGARIPAEVLLSGALGNLFLRSENYPQLRAAQNFQLLQEQLTSTENRIAYARQFFNECVRQYNTAQAAFPLNLLAGLFGFSSATLFAVQTEERAAPPAPGS